MDTILSIDNGTQSVRALIFDVQGNLLHKSQKEIEEYVGDIPGWDEHEADYYWQLVGEACNELWEQGADPTSVKGISVTTQRATLICMDENGKPLRPAITWVDQRDEPKTPKLPFIWRSLVAISGKKSALTRAMEQAESNWIAVNQPDIWKKTHQFLQLSGYLNYQLTGNFKDSVSSQVGYLPFDYKARAWAASWNWHWHAFSISPKQLPEIVKPGEKLGNLTESASQHIGLPIGIPVIAAGADKACELLGAGLIEENVGCLSYGTRATFNTHTRKYFEAVKNMPLYSAALPDMYMSEAAVPRGFWMVSWFKNEFGLHEKTLAEQKGVLPETLFDDLVNKVPPGSMGLTLQPYWGKDISPGPEAKGSIIGFSDGHTRAHMYRSILEGLAYALREGKELIEKKSGVSVNKLRVSGGGSQSDAAMQITADVFGLPASRPHTFETSGLGAAIITCVGLGVYASFEEAIGAMTREGDVFYPNPDATEIYDQLYKCVYKEMYGKLAPLYRSIQEITKEK